MTLESQPFEINTRSLNALQRLVDEMRLYASRGFPLSTPLQDSDLPFNVDANYRSTLVIPVWLATEDGWSVRSAALLVGTDKHSTSGQGTLSVKARLRTPSGAIDLGSFSSSSNAAVAGTPFMLTGGQPLDRRVPKGSSIEVFVEQTSAAGVATMTCADATVSWVLARTGA